MIIKSLNMCVFFVQVNNNKSPFLYHYYLINNIAQIWRLYILDLIIYTYVIHTTTFSVMDVGQVVYMVGHLAAESKTDGVESYLLFVYS